MFRNVNIVLLQTLKKGSKVTRTREREEMRGVVRGLSLKVCIG